MIADKLTSIMNGPGLPPLIVPTIPEIPSVDEITNNMKIHIQDLNTSVEGYETKFNNKIAGVKKNYDKKLQKFNNSVKSKYEEV